MDSFDPLDPSSRSTPDSTDFEKVERDELLVGEADSSTGELDVGGAGDAPAAVRAKLLPSDSELSGLFDFLNTIPPYTLDLLYWRCPKKTGFVFGSILVLLISLSMYSVITIVAYLALAILSGTFTYVAYRKCLTALQKSGEGNPFEIYLSRDVMGSMEQDLKHGLESTLVQAGKCLDLLRHYFLIADIFDSVKFAVFLWLLTYIGAWFNLLTITILAHISIFTLPKIYEVHRDQIDSYVNLVSSQISAQYPVLCGKVKETFGGIWDKIAVMIPGKAKAQ